MKITTVPLNRIRMNNRRFSFSRGSDPENLIRSIREKGIIDPPDLLAGRGRFTVIRGSRRLRALRRLGAKEVQARVYGEKEITPFGAWSINFFETISARSLNPAEACTVLRQLVELGLPPEKIVKTFHPLLGLPPRMSSFEEGLRTAGLRDDILESLANGRITLGTAVFLSSLGRGERASSFRFLSRARLTVSQQREWCRLIPDIASREERTVTSVLRAATVSAGHRPGNFGTEALQFLRERRYPALAARRRAFHALVRRLRLPPRFQVRTHPFFEKSELHFSFTADDSSSFQEALRRLESLGKEADFQRLMPPPAPRRRKK